MKFLEILKSRRITGDVYKNYAASKLFKNTPKDFLYKFYKAIYFKGGGADATYKIIKDQFFNGVYYDFGVLKMNEYNRKDQSMIIMELSDIVFPYIFEWEPPVGEGTYEKFGVNLEQGDIVIEAGANIGLFTAFAANRGATVHAFEPLEFIVNMLNKNIELNGVANKVVVNQQALSDSLGELEMECDLTRMGSNSLLLSSDVNKINCVKVMSITIDEYVNNNKLERVDFIKADIEGAERYMLLGARETLKKYKPKLSICIYHLPDDKDVLTKIILDANPDYSIEYSDKKLYAK